MIQTTTLLTSFLLLSSTFAQPTKNIQSRNLKSPFKSSIRSTLSKAKSLSNSVKIQQLDAINSTGGGDFTYPVFKNPEAQKYYVKTNALPLFNGIAVQDSYAGRIHANGTQDDLFFWYFPSSKKGGSNKLSIWLNGGPGCSSLEGATQENGPFNFLPGTTNPVVNPDAWTTVSDMLYIEQPAGVGFSTGSQVDLTGEIPLADDFYKFLTSFYKVFPELVTKDFYITGESYAGFYIPYIAERVLHASDAEKAVTPLNLKALFIIDGVFSDFIVGEQAPTARFSSQNAAILGFNQIFLEQLNATSKACGYETLLDSVKYPQPPGPIFLPNPTNQSCDVFDLFYNEAIRINPCFNIYHITDVCPTPFDPIGNATYFNMPEVLAGLNVANSSQWLECSNNDPFVNGIDNTPYSETVLPDIISQIPVLIVHGDTDAVLFTQSDYITFQNLTWGGVQGFTKPVDIPLLINGQKGGIWRSERNLTFVEIYDCGHMVPEFQPVLSLALFNAMLTNGSIGDGQLTAPGTFTETFPVPWPNYSTLNGTVTNSNLTTTPTISSNSTGPGNVNASSTVSTVSLPTTTIASSASVNVLSGLLVVLGMMSLIMV